MKDSFGIIFNLTNGGFVDIALENWTLFKSMMINEGINVDLELDKLKKGYKIPENPTQSIIFINEQTMKYTRSFISSPILYNSYFHYHVTIGEKVYFKDPTDDWFSFFKQIGTLTQIYEPNIKINIKMIDNAALFLRMESGSFLLNSHDYIHHLDNIIKKNIRKNPNSNLLNKIHSFFNKELIGSDSFSLRNLTDNVLLMHIIAFANSDFSDSDISSSMSYRNGNFLKYNHILKNITPK